MNYRDDYLDDLYYSEMYDGTYDYYMDDEMDADWNEPEEQIVYIEGNNRVGDMVVGFLGGVAFTVAGYIAKKALDKYKAHMNKKAINKKEVVDKAAIKLGEKEEPVVSNVTVNVNFEGGTVCLD